MTFPLFCMEYGYQTTGTLLSQDVSLGTKRDPHSHRWLPSGSSWNYAARCPPSAVKGQSDFAFVSQWEHPYQSENSLKPVFFFVVVCLFVCLFVFFGFFLNKEKLRPQFCCIFRTNCKKYMAFYSLPSQMCGGVGCYCVVGCYCRNTSYICTFYLASDRKIITDIATAT